MHNAIKHHPLSNIFCRIQWIVWKIEQYQNDKKPRKIPYDPKTLKKADTTNPETWSDFAIAYNITKMNPEFHLGFVFTKHDPFVFIDLDGCRDPETGEYTYEATQVMQMFPGAASEVSQSGTGIHIVCRADQAALAGRRNKWQGWKECYTENRFMAFGSLDGWIGNADIDHTTALLNWVPLRETSQSGEEIPSGRDPRWCGPEDENELIQRMLKAGELNDEQLIQALSDPKSLVFLPAIKRHERHEMIEALWTGDGNALGKFYPSESGQPFDHSAADQALMNVLAFWTGNDHERMLRLFSQSALGKREKWNNRPYYRNRTAGNSIRTCRNVYTGNREERRQKQRKENERIGSDLGYEIHTAPITHREMIESLWFIKSGSGGGAVANSRTGKCVPIAIARNEYAASVEHISYIDGRSGKEKQKLVPALELWLKDHQRKTADAITWKPGDNIVCDVPEAPNAVGFNTWRGLINPRFADHFLNDHNLRSEWLAPWRQHLAYLVPNDYERRLFEQWLAHIVQRPGELPQTGWCFIAANTGIGRNWLGSVLVRALRGHVLANAILDAVLAGNFNGRMSRKLLIIVDEARAGMRGIESWKHSEKLKTVVNPELREINEKHGLQRAEHNAMRWLVFSNHWDAIPIERDDRRWNVVENPTTRQSEAYYTWLYEILSRDEFISAIWAHLFTLPLDGFNVGALSLKNDARERMLGSLASEIELLLEEFKDNWPAPVAQFRDIENFIRLKRPTQSANRNAIERTLSKVGMIYCKRAGKQKTRFVITSDLKEQAIYDNPVHWLNISNDATAKFQFQ